MSDMSTVIVGVVSILSCVALVTWLARPSEFRPVRVPRAERPPKPVRVPKAARRPEPAEQPAVAPALAHLAAQQVPASKPVLPANARAEPSLADRLAIPRAPRAKKGSGARSFLYVTKVPTRR